MVQALYIHWPFCLSKCPYCDFNSHVREAVDEDEWRAALLADLRHEAGEAGEKPLNSIFFGGGTPSLMPPALVATLLHEAERLWGFAPGIEITLEANPTSIEAGNFAALAQAGINRVSLGIQSLDDEALRFLGREHSATEALRALEIAQAQFERVSFDLIYARPDQSDAAWFDELDRALSLGTDHLSLYQLTIEPGTRFATEVRRGHFTPLEEERSAKLFADTRAKMAAAGLPAYEVSNHARPGQESAHNLAYWHYCDFAGIGPGAHGRRNGFATSRHRKPENFLAAVTRNRHGMAEERALAAGERFEEAMMMGLRLNEGVDPEGLADRFDLSLRNHIAVDRIALFEREGLLSRHGSGLALTEAGMLLLDRIAAEILTPADITAPA